MKRETDVTRHILKSQNGQRIIDFVAPIYNEGETALWLFESIGRILDDISENIDSLRRQVTPEEATWSLPYWETEYNITPEAYWNDEERRAAIIAKIKYVAPVNPAKLEEFASATMGVPCKIVENIGKNTFRIIIDGWSESFPRLKQVINEAKPAHLIWNVHSDIPPIIIEELPGAMAFKKFHFNIYTNYWGFFHFNGARLFDGSLSFQNNGLVSELGLHLQNLKIYIREKERSKFKPVSLFIHPHPFQQSQKFFILQCNIKTYVNYWNAFSFNGAQLFDGGIFWGNGKRRGLYSLKIHVKEKEKFIFSPVRLHVRSPFHNRNETGSGSLQVAKKNRLDGGACFDGATLWNGKKITKLEVFT